MLFSRDLAGSKEPFISTMLFPKGINRLPFIPYSCMLRSFFTCTCFDNDIYCAEITIGVSHAANVAGLASRSSEVRTLGTSENTTHR